MNTTLLKDRLRKALDGPPRVTQADLARAAGVSKPTVSDWLSGKSQSIKEVHLKKVSRFLRVNAAWLGLGEGPMRGTGGVEVAGTIPAVESLDTQINPIWIVETAMALQSYAKRSGKRFDIATLDGANDFAYWYSVRAVLPDQSALDNVIELESRRNQQGISERGHGRSAPTHGAHGRKR